MGKKWVYLRNISPSGSPTRIYFPCTIYYFFFSRFSFSPAPGKNCMGPRRVPRRDFQKFPARGNSPIRKWSNNSHYAFMLPDQAPHTSPNKADSSEIGTKTPTKATHDNQALPYGTEGPRTAHGRPRSALKHFSRPERGSERKVRGKARKKAKG
jgi:hypothetical protein